MSTPIHLGTQGPLYKAELVAEPLSTSVELKRAAARPPLDPWVFVYSVFWVIPKQTKIPKMFKMPMGR